MSSPNEVISMEETSEEETKRLQEKAKNGPRGLLLNLDDETHNEFPLAVLNLVDLCELHLSIGNLSSIPTSICTLQSLKVLELRNQDFKMFPVAVCGITSLEVVDLCGNKISSVPSEITNLVNLKKLVLQRNELEGELSESISSLCNLQYLDVSKNSLTTIPESFEKLCGLQHLILSGNLFTRCPEVVKKLTELRTLDVSYNDLKEFSIDISGLRLLENLDLESTNLTVVCDVVCTLTSLRRLDLGLNKLETISENFSKLTKLKALWLNNNNLTSFPTVLCELRSLENLSISYNNIKSLPNSIGYLENLKMLELDNCGLEKKMPLAICMLKSLQLLSLANNNLTKLPPVLRTALPNLSFINLENNVNLVMPPFSISKRGIKAIFNFIDETESKKTIYHKAVLLGNVKAGKTSLAKTMVRSRSHLSEDEDRTVVLDRILWTPEENLSLQVYDFGGSEWYGVAQHFFLERNSIVLLVVNLKDYSETTYIDCVEKWLKVIQARAPGAKLFLVATHIDLLSQDEVKVKQDSILKLMRARENCEIDHVHKEIARLQQDHGKEAENSVNRLQTSLKDRLELPDKVYTVSSTESLQNIDELKHDLLRTAKCIGGDIPTAWLRLYDVLHNSELAKKKNFLTIQEVAKLDKEAYEKFQAKHILSPDIYRKHPPLQQSVSVKVRPVSRDTTPRRKISDHTNPLGSLPTENDERSMRRMQRLEMVDEANNGHQTRLSSDVPSATMTRIYDVLSFFHSIGDVLWYEGNSQIRNFVFHKQSFIIDLMKGIFSRECLVTDIPQELHISLTQAMSDKSLQSAKEDLNSKGILSVGLLKGMLVHLNLEDNLINAFMQLLIHFGLCFADEIQDGRLTKLHFPWFLSESPPLESSHMLEKHQLENYYQFTLEYDFPLGIPRALFETTSVRIHGIIHDKVSIKHWKSGVYARLHHSKILLHRSKSPQSETISFSVKGKDVDELWRILEQLNALFKRLLANWPGSLFEMWLVCPHCTCKGAKNPNRFQGENIERCCPQDEEYVTCYRDGQSYDVPVNLVYPVLASVYDVSESQILTVAKMITKNWRSLGRSLGLDEYELEHIDYDNRDLREKSVQMMRQWQRTKGKKANLKKLIWALESMDPPQLHILDELNISRVRDEDDFQPGSPPDLSLRNRTF